MDYKFYKVTEGEFVDAVIKAIDDRALAIKALSDFEAKVGATSTAEYNRGGIAYFNFNKAPDMKMWKKAHDGFMPRLGTKEGKLLNKELCALPKVVVIQDCLKVLGLNNMMVLGSPTSRGIQMYSASFCGKVESKTYFVKVPQEKGGKNKELPPDLVECKEWEVLKFMDEE